FHRTPEFREIPFYTDLYSEKPADCGVWKRFLAGLPSLSPQNMDKLEKQIAVVECYDALKEMKTGRSPGDDGITVDVWRVTFPIIGEYYVKMINVAWANHRFHSSYLRASLTLLKKEGFPVTIIDEYRLQDTLEGD
ncbi:unnamed protein product, partial [Didymodactylos carnosus]